MSNTNLQNLINQNSSLVTSLQTHNETLEEFNLYKDGTIKYVQDVNMTHKQNDPEHLKQYDIYELGTLENNKEVMLFQLSELRHDNRQQNIYNDVDGFKFTFWI